MGIWSYPSADTKRSNKALLRASLVLVGGVKMGPKMALEEPKMVLRWPNMAPKWAKTSPRRPQDTHKWPQEARTLLQDGPR
jgi:hypothetical protein